MARRKKAAPRTKLSPAEVVSALEKSDLFEGLGGKTLKLLAAKVDTVHAEPGQTLFYKGDQVNGCFFVFEGSLKVSVRSEVAEEDRGIVEPSETLLAILNEGDVAGEMGLVDRQPRSADVVAMKVCKLGRLRLQDFEQLADAHTEIYRHMLRKLSNRVRAANTSLTARQTLPLASRLARLFVKLAEGLGEPLPDGRILIRQKFTQEQLGGMADAARENVNRQVTQWKKQKLISRLSGYYCLEDMAAWRKIAENRQ